MFYIVYSPAVGLDFFSYFVLSFLIFIIVNITYIRISPESLNYVMIHDIIFNIFNRNRDKRDDFIEASDAYLKTTYNEQFTKEELKEKLIADIKRQIKNDVKLNRTYINVTTYSGYREKQVLPEVAEYFKTKKYKVDLHNDDDYSNTNVLIINWQNNENFKKS